MSEVNFFDTTGVERFEAVLQRYEGGEISAKLACEYLAELIDDMRALSPKQSELVEKSFHLVHDAEDGFCTQAKSFENLLRR